uniref:Uncharacterized protein n=1 Tax=Sipha flava TaxID=143950 RepID=A0A2S2QJD3_9HEMI
MYKKGQVTPVDDRGLSIPNRHVSVYFFIRGKKKGKKYDYPLSLFHHYSPRVPTRPFSSDRQFFKYLDPSVDFGHVLISLCKDLLTGDSYTDVYRIECVHYVYISILSPAQLIRPFEIGLPTRFINLNSLLYAWSAFSSSRNKLR